MKILPTLFTLTSILLAVGTGFIFFAVLLSVDFIRSPEVIHNLMLADSFSTVFILCTTLRFLFFKRIMKEAEIKDEEEREDRLFEIKVSGFILSGIAGVALLIMTVIVLFNGGNLHVTGFKFAMFCMSMLLCGLVFLFSGVLSKWIVKRHALSEEDWTVRQMSVKMLFVLLALLMQFGAVLWVK